METKKFEYIDSLRGIAILLVILVHIPFTKGVGPAMSYFPDSVVLFINNGHLGVNLFFIVSAFTLMLSHQRRQYEDHATRNFFIRRFFRIAPMYYLAIIYFTFSSYVGFNLSTINLEGLPKKELLTNILFVNGFFPEYIHRYVPGGWSITVEFTFYILFPFLFSKIKNANSAFRFVLGSLLFSSIIHFILEGTYADQGNFLGYYFIAQLPVFSLGMLAFFIIMGKFSLDDIKLSSICLLAFTILIYCYILVPYDFVYSVVFFLLLVIVSKRSYKIFSNKILAAIGKVSFSLYLMHFVMQTFFNRFDWLSWMNIDSTLTAYLYFILTYICLFTISYAASIITHKFIEIPGQNLGKILIKKLDQQK